MHLEVGRNRRFLLLALQSLDFIISGKKQNENTSGQRRGLGGCFCGDPQRVNSGRTDTQDNRLEKLRRMKREPPSSLFKPILLDSSCSTYRYDSVARTQMR